ncbi:TPA: FaeA/PapI family transcriptional regulator [Serratia marcescens]
MEKVLLMCPNTDAHLLLQVLNQLVKSDNSESIGREILPIEHWPTTRNVADSAGVSIYKARAILLEMHAQGLVLVSREVKKKNLLWHPLLAVNEQPKSPFMLDLLNRFIDNDKATIWKFK